jgi:hypothetical protein
MALHGRSFRNNVSALAIIEMSQRGFVASATMNASKYDYTNMLV